ncbi:hypothetical protein VULLAG_LOCUS23169 [Vulpes lagopus]
MRSREVSTRRGAPGCSSVAPQPPASAASQRRGPNTQSREEDVRGRGSPRPDRGAQTPETPLPTHARGDPCTREASARALSWVSSLSAAFRGSPAPTPFADPPSRRFQTLRKCTYGRMVETAREASRPGAQPSLGCPRPRGLRPPRRALDRAPLLFHQLRVLLILRLGPA